MAQVQKEISNHIEKSFFLFTTTVNLFGAEVLLAEI